MSAPINAVNAFANILFQYYIYTKDSMPMDIEFIVQDTFALLRPQWKLASNIEEATRAFQLAMAQDQKTSGADKTIEPEEPDSDGEQSDDGLVDGEGDAGIAADAEEDSESESDGEVSCLSKIQHLICTNSFRRMMDTVTQTNLLLELTRRKRQ